MYRKKILLFSTKTSTFCILRCLFISSFKSIIFTCGWGKRHSACFSRDKIVSETPLRLAESAFACSLALYYEALHRALWQFLNVAVNLMMNLQPNLCDMLIKLWASMQSLYLLIIRYPVSERCVKLNIKSRYIHSVLTEQSNYSVKTVHLLKKN